MKKLAMIVRVPVLFALSVMNLFVAVIGSLLFRILSTIVGLAAICTIWAWLIGDKMVLVFAGVTAGGCALILVGTLLGVESASIVRHMESTMKSKKKNETVC